MGEFRENFSHEQMFNNANRKVAFRSCMEKAEGNLIFFHYINSLSRAHNRHSKYLSWLWSWRERKKNFIYIIFSFLSWRKKRNKNTQTFTSVCMRWHKEKLFEMANTRSTNWNLYCIKLKYINQRGKISRSEEDIKDTGCNEIKLFSFFLLLYNARRRRHRAE